MMGFGLILVIVIAYLFFKKGDFSSAGNLETPMDILQKRYINGEINQDEFLEKKEILKRSK